MSNMNTLELSYDNNYYYICCKINKKLFNLTKGIYVCAVYKAPENSKYFSQEWLEDFANRMLAFSWRGHLLVMDDFTAIKDTYLERSKQYPQLLKEMDKIK